ncbi:response regulator [Chamaesiphon sp. VAR_48_metabat_135_sub]|uniref:response regulator n=1 Tax=Chamaesiphon sp. VAR_48_metabat_135_sub TaxID=2964699 RepID=UPI00286A3476|nr:response regulator [Chamaesiphon sp. VAR_48_metabat_135_sub]
MDESDSERLILLIDDDRDRAQLIETALQSFQHRVITIADGIEAIDFLNRRGDYLDAPRPDLILLELNLPGNEGQDLLAKIKAEPQLRRIPIVVLTTAASEADIFSTYLLQGNCHIVKSTDLDRLRQIVQRIEEFWFGIVTLPVA